MISRKFVAENTQVAFKIIRESMGPNALILSNRKVRDGVEIIAESDEEIKPVVEFPDTDVSELAGGDDIDTESANNSLIDEKDRELQVLKELLVSELSAIRIGEWETRDQNRYRLFQDMIKMGFGVSFIARLVGSLDNDADYDVMRSALTEEIVFSINCDRISTTTPDILTGVVAIHGSSGSGKTTTIGKLANNAISVHGADEIVILSADNRKIGAYQHLLGLGKVIGVPVLNVRKPWELNEILGALKNKQLVLIDSAGFTTDNLNSPEESAYFSQRLEFIQHYITLAATTQSSAAKRILMSALAKRANGIIITKTDESPKLAEILSCIIECHSKASFRTSGSSFGCSVEPFDGTKYMNDILEQLYDGTEDPSVDDAISTNIQVLLQNSSKAA